MESVMLPLLSMVPLLLMVPPMLEMAPVDVISNIIPEETVNVSPGRITKKLLNRHVSGAIHVPPIATHEAWSEMVPATPSASCENPINPRIKILVMTGTAHDVLMPNILLRYKIT